MKIGFSTSWIDCDIDRLEAVAPVIDALEIGTRGDTGFFHSLERWVRRHEMPVQSVHASAGPHKTHSEPYYTPNVVSLDPSLRQKDIDEIAFSAEWAEKLGAHALILHLGKVEEEKLKQEFLRFKQNCLSNPDERHLSDRRTSLEKRRRELGERYLDIGLKTLNTLCERFPSVTFCLETRAHLHEIPLLEEARFIIESLPVSNIGYWHDIGHTYILECLGFGTMDAWQQKLYTRCIGTHIHDVNEHLRDHQPPGNGNLDFEMIFGMFSREVLHTLELNALHTPESVMKGIHSLKQSLRRRGRDTGEQLTPARRCN